MGPTSLIKMHAQPKTGSALEWEKYYYFREWCSGESTCRVGFVHRKIKVDRFSWGNPENVSFQAVKKAHDTIRHEMHKKKRYCVGL